MGVPTFCPIHLKIHECAENSNTAISSATENKIKAKMTRMLNPTEVAPAEFQTEKGTIQYILENAKKHNQNIKVKIGVENEQGLTPGIDENDIKAKMARLRASVSGGSQNSPSSELLPPTAQKKDAGLQEIIDNAYRINRGIERIKNPEEEQLTLKEDADIPVFLDNELDQLNQKMQKSNKKTVSNTSKTKTINNKTKRSTETKKTTVKKPTLNSTQKAEKTIVLTASEVEELIEKAVTKAIKKENNSKNKK